MATNPLVQIAKALALHVPRLGDVVLERDRLRMEVARITSEAEALRRELAAEPASWANGRAGAFPPGHFYSPIPARADLEGDAERIFAGWPAALPGLDLDEEGQRARLARWTPFYAEQPFEDEPSATRRHGLKNPFFGYCDAIVLYCMLRDLRPRRIVEVGSGHSSCVILDTNELFLEGRAACTFIEPYPERLFSLIRPDDRRRAEIITTRLQDVALDRFMALEAGDVLFIDSSHVAKAGSDVNYIFAEIVPRLQAGVHVHFHDVFYPFEYPSCWVLDEGRFWNEAYVLRAFLAFNRAFEVVLFNHFVQRTHRAWLEEHMPLCAMDTGGSIWLRRTP